MLSRFGIATASSSRRLSFLRPPTCPSLRWSSHRRTFVSATAAALNENLPYHLVVGLPALSPTMSAGALAEWYVAEGDKFVAGDAIAKIETDKASIDFEAQDDGYVAKLLMEAGSGADVAVGTPIMITVEEQEDVNAFKGYVSPVTAVSASPAEDTKGGEPSAPKAVASAPPVKADTPPPPPPAPVPVPPPVENNVPASSPSLSSSSSSSSPAVVWGLAAAVASPLAKTLAAQQKAYIQAYGSTGQTPIL